MAEIKVQQHFSVGAETVWAQVGDPGAIADWIPSVATARMEQEIRHLVFADGQPARERIAEHSDRDRRYTYEYIDGPLPLKQYRSTISVLDATSEACTVDWTATFSAEAEEVESELAATIEEIYRAALKELSTIVSNPSVRG
ncbi:SRPBCC family protein [Rhodococcus wratislaviensis]|uniref:SRPBCC family protein n=1 Tax=Rhodococcus wratislaviensis TaxID=44752 RepID=UPI003518DAF0